MDKPRFQLYETFRVAHVNGYGLLLDVDEAGDRLYILHQDPETGKRTCVSWWDMSELRKRLLQKHPRTFWITAESEMISGVEHFLYTKILYTKNPNAALLTPLLASGVITVDLAAHITEAGKYRDHGVLFKIEKKNLPLLFANPEEFIL